MRRIQTDRGLLKYILLTIVTCGIYSYYFIYKLAEDVNEMCKEDGQKDRGAGCLHRTLLCHLRNLRPLLVLSDR